MERKIQVSLSAIIMYAIVGFAGSIYQVSNYWFVLVLGLLVTLLTLSNVFFTDDEVKEKCKIEWISVCSLFVVELVLTVLIEIFKIPFIGTFGIINLVIQSIGLLSIMFAVVKFVVEHTNIVSFIKDLISKKEESGKINMREEIIENEVATKVEEAIVSEEKSEELIEATEEVYNFTEDLEETVIGIELKEEPEVETPYMEEEM